MIITSITATPVCVPVRPAHIIASARGTHRASTFTIVKIGTDRGLTGLGEVSATAVWSGEDHVTAPHIIATYLAPALLGEDARDIERLTLQMNRVVAGHSFTKSGIEMALWDLLGKAAGLPVYRLLGGAVRAFFPTKFSISGLAPDEAAALARWAAAQGFRAMKVKVGLDPVIDIARVRAVRDAIGFEIQLGVDANGGWTIAQAVAALDALRDVRLAFVEQPIAPGDAQQLAWLRRRVNCLCWPMKASTPRRTRSA